MAEYIHTYTSEEGERLFKQAKRLEGIVFDNFDLSGFKNILEPGCGNGGNTKLLLSKNTSANITAFDINPDQIASAVEAVKDPRANFSAGSIYNIEHSDNSFDCAFVCWVLEHLEDPQKAIDECYRVLEQNGELLITEVFNHSLYIHPHFPAITKYIHEFNELQKAINCDPNIGVQLGNLLHNAGFSKVEILYKQIMLDKRNLTARNDMMDYYLELMLSAREGLLERNKVPDSIFAEIEKEKADFLANENAIFYYTPIQAIAVK